MEVSGTPLIHGACPHLNGVKDAARPHQTPGPGHRPPRSRKIIPHSWVSLWYHSVFTSKLHLIAFMYVYQSIYTDCLYHVKGSVFTLQMFLWVTNWVRNISSDLPICNICSRVGAACLCRVFDGSWLHSWPSVVTDLEQIDEKKTGLTPVTPTRGGDTELGGIWKGRESIRENICFIHNPWCLLPN